MKCEICHDADAVTAITRVTNGEEEELYVCHACADSERKQRQKKSQRTRKTPGTPIAGLSISVKGSGDAPPPFVEAIIKAMDGLVGRIEQHTAEQPPADPEYTHYVLPQFEARFMIKGRLHLEGLYLIGEIPAVKRAFHAVQMDLCGVDIDGLVDVGHVYEVRYVGSKSHATMIVKQLIEQERAARKRLLKDMKRVFADSLCRALAILKNCRLVSGPEVFDLLSPLRLATFERLLEGLDVVAMNMLIDAFSEMVSDDSLPSADRDKYDGHRADLVNKRFENVVLNERAERLIL